MKNPVSFAGLRVPGGRAARIWRPVVIYLLVLFSVGAASFAADEPATAGHVLAQVFLNGYRSEEVIINPTDGPIDVKRPCRDGQSSCPPITDSYAAHSSVTRRQSDIGTDIRNVTLDERLRVYSRVWTPLGHFCIVPTLSPHTAAAWFYDLPNTDEFEAYLWIAVAPGQEGTYVTIDDPSVPPDNEFNRRPMQSYRMGRGAIIERVWSSTVRVHLGAAPGWPALPAPATIYPWSFSVHKATGAIEVHP